MAKSDFFKTWEVTEIQEGITTGGVIAGTSVLCIYDDGDDKVTIQYNSFGSGYPTLQNGHYEHSEEKVTAYFTDNTHITFQFPRNANNEWNTRRLKASVQINPTEEYAQLKIIFTPEAGEWGAEACT